MKDKPTQEIEKKDVASDVAETDKDSVGQWLLRFLKGAIVGTGGILPGVSGGVLCIVFGFYERMMSFLANITHNFKKNLFFFIPIGLGFISSFVLLSKAIGAVLKNTFLAPVFIWLFIGAIVGTIPFLYKEAAHKDTKKSFHIIITVISTAVSLGIMMLMKSVEAVNPTSVENIGFITWVFCGIVMALGAVLPGMSPSSILIYTNLYGPMSEEIGRLNISMIIPFGIGAVLTIVLLSKFVNWLFKKFRTGMYYIILGVVIASTLLIIPIPNYTTITNGIVFSGYTVASGIFSFLTFAVGLTGTFLLGKLENKVKK